MPLNVPTEKMQSLGSVIFEAGALGEHSPAYADTPATWPILLMHCQKNTLFTAAGWLELAFIFQPTYLDF